MPKDIEILVEGISGHDNLCVLYPMHVLRIIEEGEVKPPPEGDKTIDMLINAIIENLNLLREKIKK